MTPRDRQKFDAYLEEVVAGLPPMIVEALERVPLHVEDYPSPEMMESLHLEYRDDLCGLHTGIPLPEKSVEHSGVLPDVVTIYREGILSLAIGRHGRVNPRVLREEIRKTILHEFGHHFGLSEQDLEDLGYA